jgi:hypothetical protein
MAGSWNQNVNFIQDGERVDAKVSGRPDRALTDRTQYLKDRIDAIDSGRALYAFSVSVESSVAVGQAVYWNVENQRFEKALSNVFVDENGILVNSTTSEIVGVVHSKESATIANLLIAGQASLDISAAVDGAVEAGRYFLSGTQAGFLVKQATSVSIPVLINDGNGVVYVQIQPKDLSESHQHYKMELFMEPAGTADVETVHGSARAVIIDPDPDLPGWLPASHTIFEGIAPPRAAFGYNLPQHASLSRIWPPIPEESASVTVFMNLGGPLANTGLEIPTGPDGLVIIDRNGIWWMSDCDGEAPWQDYYNSATSETSSISYPECPRNASSKLVLYFSKVKYGSGSSVVTSLRNNSTSSPLVITDLDGNAAHSGDLKIAFDSNFLVTSNTATGSLVLKTVTDNTFTRGRVTEGIKAANGSVTITSTESRLDGSDTLHQGIISIGANLEGISRFILPQIVRLIDVKERYESNIMYLGMSAGMQSSVRYKFKLPGADAFPTNPKLKLRLWLTGDTQTATFPSLSVTYRRIPRATAATSLPTTDTIVTLTTGMALGIDEYIEKDSAQFTVAESDVVLFTVTRSASDGYLGEIGIIDAIAVLSPGS